MSVKEGILAIGIAWTILFANGSIRQMITPSENFRIFDDGDGREKSRDREVEQAAENMENLQKDNLSARVEAYLQTMTVEEKIAQLFIITPEQLVHVNNVTAAGETTRAAFDEFPVGGFMYMENNLISPEQVKEMLTNIQSYSLDRSGLPVFTCVDEEGGTVSRISGRESFHVPYIESMSDIGLSQNVSSAYSAGKKMGQYLSELGFNVDFAPVADVLSNSDNQVVKYRSFGDNPQLVSEMSEALLDGLEEQEIFGTLKHFPGHGCTEGDTHDGFAYSDKTLEELQKCELLPFENGIKKGVHFIMVGHISFPEIIGDQTPASLSEIMVHRVLRGDLGYDGIVITDALNMGAVTANYTCSQAAVSALLAGVDIILMPEDFYSAYYGILDAVKNDIISSDRIDDSLTRILKVKLQIKDKLPADAFHMLGENTGG